MSWSFLLLLLLFFLLFWYQYARFQSQLPELVVLTFKSCTLDKVLDVIWIIAIEKVILILIEQLFKHPHQLDVVVR